MSIAQRKERRVSRIQLPLPIRVEAQESKNVFWREITHLLSVSPLGASFYLKHRFAVGQLLHLIMPLPISLRSYDHSDQQYGVWAIVRYCHPIAVLDASAYHIGVAFVGKHPPLSYKENPLTIYRILDRNGTGLWEIAEDDRPSSILQQPRYSIPITISIATLDERQNIVAQEITVTENISKGGAAAFSTLPVEVGDLVKIICEQYNVSLLAEVRSLRCGQDGLPRIHLKFVNEEFPLQGIEQI